MPAGGCPVRRTNTAESSFDAAAPEAFTSSNPGFEQRITSSVRHRADAANAVLHHPPHQSPSIRQRDQVALPSSF
ncbi:MAG: hypothetical protein ABI473_04710, partial [Candidatus Dormibacter sp.]